MFTSFFCDPCCTSSKNVRKDEADGESIFSMLSCGGRHKSKTEKMLKNDESSNMVNARGILAINNNYDKINLKSSEFKEFRHYLKRKF